METSSLLGNLLQHPLPCLFLLPCSGQEHSDLSQQPVCAEQRQLGLGPRPLSPGFYLPLLHHDGCLHLVGHPHRLLVPGLCPQVESRGGGKAVPCLPAGGVDLAPAHDHRSVGWPGCGSRRTHGDLLCSQQRYHCLTAGPADRRGDPSHPDAADWSGLPAAWLREHHACEGLHQAWGQAGAAAVAGEAHHQDWHLCSSLHHPSRSSHWLLCVRASVSPGLEGGGRQMYQLHSRQQRCLHVAHLHVPADRHPDRRVDLVQEDTHVLAAVSQQVCCLLPPPSRAGGGGEGAGHLPTTHCGERQDVPENALLQLPWLGPGVLLSQPLTNRLGLDLSTTLTGPLSLSLFFSPTLSLIITWYRHLLGLQSICTLIYTSAPVGARPPYTSRAGNEEMACSGVTVATSDHINHTSDWWHTQAHIPSLSQHAVAVQGLPTWPCEALAMQTPKLEGVQSTPS